MLELTAVHKLALILVELDYFYLVLYIFEKGAKTKSEVLLRPIAKIDRIQGPLRLMLIDLLSLCLVNTI